MTLRDWLFVARMGLLLLWVALKLYEAGLPR